MTTNNQIKIAMPFVFLVALAIQFATPSANAATVYWDSNGTVAGAGATPTGTWGTSTFWNATSTGLTTTPAAWVSGDTAVFSAGTDAVNAFTVTLSGTQTIGGLTVEEGTPTISGGTALAINNALTPFSIVGTLNISSVISGTAFGISKTGAGTLVLSGANTYTGATTVTAGVVRATTVAGALGAGALSLGAGQLQLANDTGLNFARNTTVTASTSITSDRLTSGAGVTHTLGTLSIGAQTLTINAGANATGSTAGVTFGATTLTAAPTFSPSINTTLTVAAVTGATFTINKSGAGTLTATGVIGTTTGGLAVTNGTMILGNTANTFTGNITVDGASSALQVNAVTNNATSGPFGIFTGGLSYKTVTLSNGGIFRPNVSYNDQVPTAALPGNGVIFIMGTGGGTFDVPTGVTLTVDDGTGTGVLAAASQLQGAGNLTKTGLGTLVQDDSTAYAGTITVTAGTLQPASANAFGANTAGTIIQSGAQLNVAAITMTNAEPLTISGTGLASAPVGALTSTGTATWVGPITLSGAATIHGGAGSLTLSAGATVNIGSNVLTLNQGAGRLTTAGVISGLGSVNVTGTGLAGDWADSGAHTYSGGTTLNTGTQTALAIGSVGVAAPVGAGVTNGPFGTGTLVLNGGSLRCGTGSSFTAGNAVTLQADTTFYTVATEKTLVFAGPVTITGATRTLTSTVGTTVTGTTVSFTGPIGDGGSALGLTKAGAGNVTLAGVNTYTGATTVNAGTLSVTGSLQSNTALTVSPSTAAGATFTLVNGAANALSNVSTLTLGSATGPTTIGLDLGTTSDSITTPNAAVVTGSIVFNISAVSGFGGAASYTLMSAASGLTAGGATYSLTNAPGGFTYSLTTTDTQISLNVTAGPTGDLFWRGSTSSSWSTFSGTTTNWFTDLAGTTNAQSTPGALNTVNFSTINASGSPTITTTLDNNFTVNNLLFSSNPNGVSSVTIAPALTPGLVASILTITPASVTDGISVPTNSGNVTISAPVALGAPQLWNVDGTGANGSSLTVSGAISGLGTNTLTINGGGTGIVTLSAAAGTSTYSGSTTVPSGAILQGGATNSFSANSALTVNGTGILRLNGFSNTVLSLTGSGTIQNNHASTAATLTFGDANNTTFSGLLQNGGVGTLGITKNGAGSLTLTNTNTHTGTTTINAGTLIFGSPTVLSSTNNVVLAGTGTLDLNGFSQTIGSLTSAANTAFITNTGAGTGASTATTSGTPTGTGVYVDTLNVSTALAASVTALITDGPTRKTQMLVNNANGSVTVSNTANTFSGGLVLANSAAGTRMAPGTITGTPFGSGPIIIGQSNTDKAGIYFATATQTMTNPIVFNTALGTDRVGIRSDVAGITLSGVITANLAPATFTAQTNTGTITLTNQVTGASGLVLDIVSLAAAATTFTVTLNNATANANNYQGDTVINFNATTGKSATLTLGRADQLPNGTGTGTVIINSNTTGIGTLNLAGFSDTINGLSGNGTITSTGAPTLTLGDNNATASFSGVIQNAIAITKIGNGTQSFAGATSTFTGTLSVNGGLVAFDTSPATVGPLGNSTVVNLSGGGISYTATGSNALNRPIVIGGSDGTVNVSNALGTLTISSVTSTTGNLIKTGSGAAVIAGTTSLNAGAASVSVTDGMLQAGFGTGGIASLSVGSTGHMNLNNSAIQALTLGNSAGALTLANGAQLSFEMTGTITNDSIAVGATGTAVTAGTVTLNFVGTVAAGTYNLITAPSGLSGATYALGSAPNGFNYTINATDILVSVTVAPFDPLYWRGGENLSWATGTGIVGFNWSTDPAGLVDFLNIPNPLKTVIFSATGAPTLTNTITTTLDSPFGIDSLQFSNVPTGITDVTITPGAGGTLNLTPASTSGGIRVLNGGGNAVITAPLTVGAAQTWDVHPTGSLAINANTVFNAAVNKTSTGVLTLSGTNSGTGAITLSSGTLNINSTTAIGTSGMFTIGAGTTINNSTAAAISLSTTNAKTFGGDFTFTGTNDLNLGAGAVTMSSSNVAITASGSNLTLAGNISDGGNNRSLTKLGAGTLTLSGTNTYSGGTTWSAGNLNINNASAIGTGFFTVAGGTLDNTSGADVTLTTNNAQAWNTNINFPGSSSLNLGTGAVAMSSARTVTVTANTLTVGGAVSGAFALTKDGLGMLVLGGANTYTGATTVSTGTVTLSGNRTATATGGITVGNLIGSTGTLNITNGTFTTSTFFVGSGISPTSIGIVNHSAGSLTMSGNQLLIGNGTGTTAGTSSNGTYNLSGGTLTTVASTLGVVLGTNTGTTATFNLSGSGILTMPATSTMQIARSDNSPASNTTGTFNQTGGTATVGILQMSGTTAGAVNNAGASSTLNLTGGTFSAATFNALSGGNTSTSTIIIGGTAQVTLPIFPTNVKGTTATANITFDSTTGFLSPVATSATYMPVGTFTNAFLTANGAKFNVGTGKDITVAQVFRDATSPAAVGALTKDGAGVLTLTGANIYTGATVVLGGTLQLNGSAATGVLPTGSITVGAGSTLGFTTATATTLDLTGKPMSVAGTLAFDVGASGINDTINVDTFTLTGNTAFTFNSIGAIGGNYVLVTATNGITTNGFTMTGQNIGRVTLTPVVIGNQIVVNTTLFEGEWNQTGGGLWSLGNAGGPSAPNWNNYKPTVPGDAALFGSFITAASTVNVDTPHTVSFLRFDNSNPYTIGSGASSNLTLNNGANNASITLTSGSHTIAERVLLLSNTVLQPATGTTLTVSGALSGAGGLNQLGLGTTLLSGVNPYTGATNFSAGTLNLTGSLTGGGAMTVSGTGVLSESSTGVISGASSLTHSSSGTSTLAGANTYTGTTNFSAGTLNLTGSLSGGGAMTISGNAVLSETSTGVIGGATVLTLSSTGTSTLAGANTFTGTTNVNAGTLNISGTGSITGLPASSKLSINSTTGNAVVNYTSSGTSTLFAITGATAVGTASAYNQSAGLVIMTPNTTTSVQGVVNATGAYGYYNISGGTLRDTTGVAGISRFTVTNQGTAGVSATNGTGVGVQTGVIYVNGTGFIDHTNAEWWLSYSLGQITLADSGKIDHTGSNNPFGVFLNPLASTPGGAYSVVNIAGAGAQLIIGAQSMRYGNSTTANNGDGNSAFINLAAGTLSMGTIATTSLPAAPTATNFGYYNYAGGTVKSTAALTGLTPATGASMTFIHTIYGAVNNSALAGAPSFTGGLTVDTNNFAVAIPTPFLVASGVGVTQADLTVSGGTGYIGAPAVIFSSAGVVSGGSPAAGYALISGGAVAGIVITAPGTYTSGTTPTVSLIGGGGTGASVTVGSLNTSNTAGGLTKTGLGILTLSGTSTYTGVTTVNQGSITLTTASALGSAAGNTVINSGTEVTINTTGLTIAEPFNIAGLGLASTGALHTGGNATVNLTGAIVLSANAGFQGDGGTTNTLSGGIDTAGFSMTFNGTGTTSVSTNGIIGSSGSVIKNTGGILNLNAANTYSGTTTINAGTVNLGHANALQNTSGITMATGTILQPSIVGPVTVTAPITTSGAVTIDAPATANGAQTFNEFVLNGVIGGTGNVTFNNTNNINQIFTVTLGAANNYNGTTLLDNSAGTAGQIIVKLGVNNALPTTTVVTIDGKAGTGTGRYAEINLNGFNQTLAGLTNVAQTLRLQRVVNSDVSAAATLTINNTSDFSFSANLGSSANGSVNSTAMPGSNNGNNFGLTKSGSATFTLTGANTYFGGTTLNQGTLTVGTGGTIGATTGPLSVNNTNSTTAGTAAVLNLATAVDTTVGSLSGTIATPTSGTNTATINNGGTGRNFTVNQTADGSYNGVIAGAGNFTLGSLSTNTLTLAGANTFTGSVAINAGSLQLGHANAINAASTVTFGGGTLRYSASNTSDVSTKIVNSTTGAISIDTNAQTVTFASALASSNTLGLTKIGTGVLVLTAANAHTGPTTISGGTLELGGTSGALPIGGAFVNNGTFSINRSNNVTQGTDFTASGITGTGGLTKQGSGTLILSGTHTYSGSTLISGGDLRGTSTLTNSAVTINSTGSVWPGSSLLGSAVGTGESMTVNSIDLTAGKLKIALNATFTQSVAVTGNANITNGTLSLGIPSSMVGGSAVVMTYGTLTGTTFGTVIVNGVTYSAPSFAGMPVTIDYTTGNAITVSVSGTVTPVKVVDFKAEPKGAGVNVSWTAISEYQNAGFNVYRRVSEGGEWVLANPALIAGRITNPDEKIYSFFDWASAGEWQYKLESVDLFGTVETYEKFAGPVALDVNSDVSVAAEVDAVSISSAMDGFVMMAGVRNAQQVSATIAAMKQNNAVVMETAVVHDLTDIATVTNKKIAARSVTSAPSVSMISANAIGVRWFTSSTLSGSTYSAAKLLYSKPGVMFIPQSSMPNGYTLNNVSLQREGRNLNALAKLPSGLLVYAPGYQDQYTDKDAVFIRKTAMPTNAGNVPTTTGLFNSLAPVNVSSPATVTNDYHDVYFDYNAAYRPFTFSPWFSNKYLTQGTTQDFVINLPQATSGPAKLTLNLWSLTSSPINPDHALQLVVNGQIVGDAIWDGGNKMMQMSFFVPTGVISAGDNTVSVVTPILAGVSSQICFMHSIIADYTRLLDGSKSVEIVNSTSSAQLYELNNVPSTGAWVVDTRYSDRASLVATETQVQADGTLRLRFMANAGGSGKFVVTPVGQENQPISIVARLVKPLTINGVYLATGPAQFASGVQALLVKRAKEDIRGSFVDQEQLFDYYNYGRFGPDGIRNAVRSTRPTYLLLVGRTTYDYRNYEGKNIDPLCPAYLVATSFWAQTTSDSAFGDLGRGYPEVAVGRLPVNNTTELAGAISHILGYKGIPQTGLRLHAVADQPDAAVADFGTQLDTLVKAYNPDVTWQENYLARTYQTSPEVTDALKTAANGGADVILYNGHGNAAYIGTSYPAILDKTSVQQWTGNTVFLQSTCTANWMAKNVDDYKSIAIQALTQPQGGISASIATSTYMNPDVATAFMNQLIKNANGNGVRWGAVLLKTQQWAGHQSGSAFFKDLMNTEQLFGDPAMPVFAPKSITTTPNRNSGAGTPVGTF